MMQNLSLTSYKKALFFLVLFSISIASGQVFSSDSKPDLQKKSAPASKPSKQSFPFDYYVFSLIWSPSYCMQNSADSIFCSCKKGFEVHGLWPQLEKSPPFLTFCIKDAPKVPCRLAQSLLDIVPTVSLVEHEWQKHGTCSGLSQTNYFKKTRLAYKNISIPKKFKNISSDIMLFPQEVIEKFRSANNSDIPVDGMFIYCRPTADKNVQYLTDVMFCMDKKLKFRSCGEVSSLCSAEKIVLPALTKNQ